MSLQRFITKFLMLSQTELNGDPHSAIVYSSKIDKIKII
jgi:hypothetical protein